MSPKENAATNQLLALLEARYAMRVLWALRDGHPQTFRLLQDSVGNITPNTLNTRIKEMREAGIVSHGGEGYCLTATGQDLLRRLSDLQAFAVKWQVNQVKKNVPAPLKPDAPPPEVPPAPR
jgi:DNA-binding HxlR family transcriptional regulator